MARKKLRQLSVVLGLALLGPGCGGMAPSSKDVGSPAPQATEATGGYAEKEEAKADRAAGEVALAEPGMVAPASAKPAARDAQDDEQKPQASDDGEALRKWFPEAFLWQPLVETDALGRATVDVRVPDQLTTWRVLALAHSRDGAQAGAVHTFDSRLPLYVDPVVPGWMYAGDRLELPIQVVNTTTESVSTQLRVEASGPLSGQAVASVLLPGGASDLRKVTVTATGAGPSRIRATLVGSDAAEREIPVIPYGRPVDHVRGGTLSSSRSFVVAGPAGADPATQELVVLVYPGPLAVLQAEVERGGAGATPSDAAYGFALASRMNDLAGQMHVDVDPKQIRRVQLVSWQRVVAHSRAPDPATAADLLAALRDVTGHELAVGLADRMAQTVVSGQRADGTWTRATSGVFQQVLVETAFSARALPAEHEASRLRASGAFERHIAEIEDPYTAAVVRASGVVDSTTAEQLEKIVLDAVVTGPDGSKTVTVPGDVVNPWGWRPSQAEMLAWTWLALADRSDLDWRGDLVAELMAGYDARRGFGAGPADVIALEAVARGLPGLDKDVELILSVGGQEVDRAKLDPSQPKVPAMLFARRAGDVKVQVVPEVPGLSFVSTLHSWVPWNGDEQLNGVDVEVHGEQFAVGRDNRLVIRLAAPSGTSLAIEQGLPAGAVVDEQALGALSDRLVEWEVSTDRVRLVTRAFNAGEIMAIPLVVRPAFAGRFSTVPLSIGPRYGRPVQMRPFVWDVAGG